MAVHVGYQPATRCTDGPTPGARAFMAWFLGAYGARGGKNLGIYNCRTVRGGTTTSLHGEGRAVDFGVNPHGAAWGTALAELLRVHSAELGVQCVIWNRRIWSGSQPHAGWRPYPGVNPHRDHLHVELTRSAAQTLTAARVAAVLTTVPPPSKEDALTPEQFKILRGDVGFARDQILTRLGVANPSAAPARLAPVEQARTEPARRVDVGHARDQLMQVAEEIAGKLDALLRAPVAGAPAAVVTRAEFDDLMRRVLAIEARLVPSDPGGS